MISAARSRVKAGSVPVELITQVYEAIEQVHSNCCGAIGYVGSHVILLGVTPLHFELLEYRN